MNIFFETIKKCLPGKVTLLTQKVVTLKKPDRVNQIIVVHFYQKLNDEGFNYVTNSRNAWSNKLSLELAVMEGVNELDFSYLVKSIHMNKEIEYILTFCIGITQK